MKILISHRYYWPDTPPYGLMLHKIAGHLSLAGIDVSVFSTQPSYHGTSSKEKGNLGACSDEFPTTRIRVLNENKAPISSRPLNAIWYAVRLFSEIITKRPDIVTASTFPPVVAALSAGLACRIIGAKFIYHMMDVYPEVAYIRKKKNFTYSILRKLDIASISLADTIAVLSSGMKQTLVERGIEPEKVLIINNIEIKDDNPSEFGYDALLKNFNINKSSLIIGFAGNIGLFQGLDYISELIEKTKDNAEIQYIFMGDGKFKSTLEKNLENLTGKTVHFIGHQSINVARTLMSGADLNIVSLSPGVSSCSFPSKTITIASESGAFLIVDEPGSSLSMHIQSHGAGLTGSYNQISDLALELSELCKQPKRIESFRSGSKNMYHECFSEKSTLDQWKVLMGNLTDE